MRIYFFLPFILIAFFFFSHNYSFFFVADSNETVLHTNSLIKSSSLNWWEIDSLTAEGYGSIPVGQSDFFRAKLLAKRIALLDAYRNLAAAAGNIRITAYDTLTNHKVEALIKGADVLSESYDELGNCSIVLSVPIYGLSNSFAMSAFLPVDKLNFPAPTGNVVAKGNYTGLIIDCGDLELNPVLSPVIRDENNQSIYAYDNLDYDKVIAKGMIGYSEKKSLKLRNEDEIILLKLNGSENEFKQIGSKIFLADADGNLSRAGDNPLIIKAESLGDDNSCPVISAEDADKILSENLTTHFLDEGAVVFTSNRIRGMRL